MRFCRGANGKKGNEKNYCEVNERSEGVGVARAERKERYISGWSKALGFLHGEARGNLRCAANVSLPGSAHRQLPNFEWATGQEVEREREKERESRARASVSRWRLIIEIRCLGSRADRKSREQTLLSRTARNLHRVTLCVRASRVLEQHTRANLERIRRSTR